jgi:DnaJ-class molecular chaperone
MYGGILGDGHRAKNQPRPDPPKDDELVLKCTLAEFYNGSLKTINYKRD